MEKEIINDLYLVDAIVTDERFGEREFNDDDFEKLQKCKNEWRELFRPISRYSMNTIGDEMIIVDLFFEDYEPIKEMILDKCGEVMAVFEKISKKIDEKAEKK